MPKLKIKVVGVGGAGGNTVSRMAKSGKFKNVDFIAINTDSQALSSLPIEKKILVGRKTTGGLGTGMDWRLGERAAKENEKEIEEAIKGTDIIFLTAGLGGGSGTSGISVVGGTAKSLGILTIAVVTLPFSFEGKLREKIAKIGLGKISQNSDAFLIIPNDRVLKIVNKNVNVKDAFLKVDSVLFEALEGISELLSKPGIISVDFADIEEIIRQSGKSLLGIGVAKGEQRAISAASRALQSPLLDVSPKQAKGILFSVFGRDISLSEVNIVANFIRRMATLKTKIIFGVSDDKNMAKGEIKVILIATGID